MTTSVLTDRVVGSITPRIYTPPIATGSRSRRRCKCGCGLTDKTSYGFRVADFAKNVLKRPLWAWQEWLVIHAGELNADGSPRFRRVLVTVGRQNGKTTAVEVLTLFWLFEEKRRSVLGTSTLTKYAKKPWMSAFKLATTAPPLLVQMPENPSRKAIRRAAGEEEWWTAADCHYAVAASNAEGGRSMSNERVIADEMAKQYNYDAYSAAYYSMQAFEDAQYWGLTTPDAKGIVYTELRDSAIKHIENGEGDPSLGLFEWSCPVGADPLDLVNLCMANPTINHPGGTSGERMLREARAAAVKGGDLLRSFQIEVMCMQLAAVDSAVDLEAWRLCLDPGSLDEVRSRVALVFDVAPSLQHASLYAAAVLADGRVRVDAVHAWEGPGCADRAARELPGWISRVRPRAFAWLPNGPGASVGARLRSRPEWRTEVQEIRGELTQVAMGFSQLVAAGNVAHSGDPLLDADVELAQKLPRGDAWVFSRKGEGDCDALYAAAGAVWLAQSLPVSVGGARVLLPTVR